MKEEITPETYKKINEELRKEGVPLQIEIPTQEAIDKWRKWSESYYYEEPDSYPNLVEEHWKEYNKNKGEE